MQNKSYYTALATQNTIDKQRIYNLTKKINDSLHIDFGIKNLYHRMIFTACALVGKRFNALLVKGMNFTVMKNSILSALAKSLDKYRKQNLKLDILIEVYAEIRMNNTANQEAIDNFIENITEISECVNSDYWNGEDVMGIFFNEFNRYKKKSESGQVFTPDNITSFMYRLINVNHNDKILDAACGSGAFLVKSMCNMIKEVGGRNAKEAKIIQDTQLYGIEFDREIFALACANMLIHLDGKTNLEQLDSRSQEACDWIKSKPITKVLMNPPFESKYGCLTIVDNVLKNVAEHTICAFILPDKKLEKDSRGPKLLKHSKLLKIIKLPEKTFEGVTTSIFVFEAGVKQNNDEIFACYIEDDGLETVKNQGRQDVKDRWQKIEDEWINIIRKQSGNDTIQWIKPTEHLSYQMPEQEFEINKQDFTKTIMDYLLFQQGIDVKEFGGKLLDKVLYESEIIETDNGVSVLLKGGTDEQNSLYKFQSAKRLFNCPNVDVIEWGHFSINSLFKVIRPAPRSQISYQAGNVPFVASGNYNNGVIKYVLPKTDEALNKGNCISISPIDGSTFYQPVDFLGRGGAGSSIILLYNEKLNNYNGLFIAATIQKFCRKYIYNDMANKGTISNEVIKLPVDKAGAPDFLYMEKYMKNLENLVKNNIEMLQKITL